MFKLESTPRKLHELVECAGNNFFCSVQSSNDRINHIHALWQMWPTEVPFVVEFEQATHWNFLPNLLWLNHKPRSVCRAQIQFHEVGAGPLGGVVRGVWGRWEGYWSKFAWHIGLVLYMPNGKLSFFFCPCNMCKLSLLLKWIASKTCSHWLQCLSCKSLRHECK